MSEQAVKDWQANRLEHWFTQAWGAGLAECLASVRIEPGDPVDFRPEAAVPNAWDLWQEPVWFVLSSDLSDAALLHVGCSSSTTALVAKTILGDAPDDVQECADAYVELLNGAASATASAVSAKLGRRVEISQATRCEPPPDFGLALQFRFDLGEESGWLAVVPNEGWVGALAAEADADDSDDILAPVRQQGGGAEAANKPAAGKESRPPQGPAPGQNNLDMLLDVELDLSVSFGRTELSLAEVLKLSTGAIVELNRSVSDPVEVLVNESVIARGEVVVVEGNYGIRVTEIQSRKERMKSIF